MDNKELREHIFDQDKEIYDLIAKVIEVVKNNNLWDDNDSYIFDNGEVWKRFEPDNNGDTNE